MNLIRIGRRAIRGMRRASPYILTATAVAGVGTTAVLAVKATPPAMRDLQEAAEKKQARLTKTEAVKIAAPHYIPAVVSGVITSGCMLLSTHISMRRSAGLAAAATAAQNALNTYSDHVADKFGKEKEQEIHDDIAVEKMRQNPPSQNCVIETGDGQHLFFFAPHNVWFRSDRETVRRTLNEFNAELVKSDGLPENDLLYALYRGSDDHGYTFGFLPPSAEEKTSLVEFRYVDYCDSEGYPNPDYETRYILNGEAATVIDYAPWSEPVCYWDQ